MNPGCVVDVSERHFAALEVYYGARFSKKNVPSKPAVSVSSGRTKNVCLFSPIQCERNSLLPFYFPVFPTTPYGHIGVTRTSPLDMYGCYIDTVEPVSTIRRLAFPSISTGIEGAPSSNRTETEDFLTPLSGASRWKALSSFSTLTRFPDFSFLSYIPTLPRARVFRR
jgi:hypothetical protein